MAAAYQGSLFTNDFVEGSIADLPEWEAVSDEQLGSFRDKLTSIFDAFPIDQTPNEATTENDLIWPVLEALGWNVWLTQQNLTRTGRRDVPDAILFIGEDEKARANEISEEWRRYGLGAAVLESKRWLRPLDRRSEQRAEVTPPATQILRYMRRIDDLTNGGLRWGLLTNGLKWRLYYAGAPSIAEGFFEIDLGAVLGLKNLDHGLFRLNEDERNHWLQVFLLMFRRQAFELGPEKKTFHQRALEEGKFYEERVAQDLSNLVFQRIFPTLAQGIAQAAPDADLQEVREAALILLYRLLFILYAEDRELLPIRDSRYDDYGLRERVRLDVRRRKDQKDTFSTSLANYWSAIDNLSRALNEGDRSIGLPPYNGGLFSPQQTPLLDRVRLGDALMAEVIDALSFRIVDEQRRYINYRDLSVQQLGSIYERLLEFEVVRVDNEVRVRPNIFARKGSGSYYTPDDLVRLIIDETLEPLVARRAKAFAEKSDELANEPAGSNRRSALRRLDPAERLLDLKICDPAMGSGHFLVSLVDKLADAVLDAMAEVEAAVHWAEYNSPLADRVQAIRNKIEDNAEENGWDVDPEQLEDRHIVRRMVLKRCVYGVDKNPMAVELAKVSLWLHSFTVGAPLSFLDHHLRCGDSLFGSWVRSGIEKATAHGSPLLLHDPIRTALGSAASMQMIEGLPDVEIAEAHRSQEIFDSIEVMTAPLDAFLSLLHALEWQDLRGRENSVVLQAFFDGEFGNPFEIAQGKVSPRQPGTGEKDVGLRGHLSANEKLRRFNEILAEARQLISEERFLNWQVAFPGVWTDWEVEGLTGGFDAVIGNPPWDRMKLQQVEWFADRREEIAKAQRASDRTKMIAELKKAGDPLYEDFTRASNRAETAARLARSSGDYPLLSSGDINLYSLFVERAMTLARPEGMVGLLTPSGIASDKTASQFFKSVSTQGRLKALYDFENRKVFFPDVHASFKFCIFVAGKAPTPASAKCAFYLHAVDEVKDPERCFEISAADFARVNPNTGTAPIFRSARDAELTKQIYQRLPVLVDRTEGQEHRTWPVRYVTMFHMTNDSGLFRTKVELEEEEKAYPIGQNRYKSDLGEWVPVYEGKMVQAYDHRAANVVVNPANRHRPAQPVPARLEQHQDPDWLPDPQFWVLQLKCGWNPSVGWVIGFKDITATTNVRTFIGAIFPLVGFGNKVPILEAEGAQRSEYLLLANLNSVPLDYTARQKVQGQSLNLYIVEQLPVVPPEAYETTKFGSKTAGEIVREAVLELTYTAHDMAPFARDMGYVDEDGEVKPPFVWDEERRLHLKAKLDALYFHLYGITDRDDVRYIYSTFPIVEREEVAAWGRYRSRDLCLHYMNALAAGDPDAKVDG